MAAKKVTHIDSRGNIKTYNSASDVPDESARKLLRGTEAGLERAVEATAKTDAKKESK